MPVLDTHIVETLFGFAAGVVGTLAVITVIVVVMDIMAAVGCQADGEDQED